MKILHVTEQEQRLARTFLDWFPTFAVSTAYTATLSWPEQAWNVAQRIRKAEIHSKLDVCNESIEAWRIARRKLQEHLNG